MILTRCDDSNCGFNLALISAGVIGIGGTVIKLYDLGLIGAGAEFNSSNWFPLSEFSNSLNRYTTNLFIISLIWADNSNVSRYLNDTLPYV